MSVSTIFRPRVALVIVAAEAALFTTFAAIYLSPLTPHAVWQSAGGPTTLIFVLPFLAFATVGALIAYRRPENRVGWAILIAAASFGLGALADLFASLLTYAHNPLGAWIGLGGVLWGGTLSPATFLLLVALLSFPDGRLPSRRWRWVLYAAAAFLLMNVWVGLVDPAPGFVGIGFSSDTSVNATNPLAVPALAGIMNVFTSSPLTTAASFVIQGLAVLSVFLRLRGADNERRHQIRWFASGATVTCVGLAVSGVLPNPASPTAGLIALYSVVVLVSLLATPAAVAVALLKYRLYDIDIVISRALVYGALAAFITAVYVGIAVGIGVLVGSGGKPNLGLSILATAIVAVGFQPLRHRLQRLANRLVYGKRATPYEVLSEFSHRAGDTLATDEVLPRMAMMLREGTGAESATVWVRSGDELRPAATQPAGADGHPAVPIPDMRTLAIPGADLAIPVENQGEMLGAFSIVKRRGEVLTPAEAKLVDDLANQAGLVLKNATLTVELMRRMDELRESRQRLVQAQDTARRRLERNLHDGAQQHLVALKVKIGLVKMLAQRDPPRARATIAELQTDADEALDTLRDLARGIYPPLLAERGLAVALESQAQRATVPVRIDAAGIGRYSQDVEATVYFCVLEALQNVQKYARASRATVTLRDADGALAFEVADDGVGFDPATAARGSGLTNMGDRLDALDGSLEIDSPQSGGTTVRGRIPLGVPV